MKFEELQQKTMPELEATLSTLRGELHGLRFRASEGQLKNVRSIRVCRKSIAQVLTIISRKSAVASTAAVVS